MENEGKYRYKSIQLKKYYPDNRSKEVLCGKRKALDLTPDSKLKNLKKEKRSA